MANTNHESPTKIISLAAAKEIRQAQTLDEAYRERIVKMSKVDLLDELVHFQEERTRVGHLTLQMMVRGKCLFSALEDTAETREMRLLVRSYKRHLDYEMQAFLKPKPIANRSR